MAVRAPISNPPCFAHIDLPLALDGSHLAAQTECMHKSTAAALSLLLVGIVASAAYGFRHWREEQFLIGDVRPPLLFDRGFSSADGRQCNARQRNKQR